MSQPERFPAGKMASMQDTRITGMNELGPARRETAELYLRLSGLQAVLVGAFCGELEWDIRPLILQSNVTSLLRMSDPSIPPGGVDLQRFALEYQEVSRQPGLFGSGIISGKAAGRVWALRPYYSETLSEPGLMAQLRSQHGSEQLLKQFLDQIRTLHSLGLAHGNLSTNNLSYKDGRIILLDFAFDALAKIEHISGVPEIQAGADLSKAADIYCLGKILPQLLGAERSSTHSFLLQAMQHMAAENRPSIEEVYLELFPGTVMRREVKKPKHIISGVSLQQEQAVSSGRLINPGQGMRRSRAASLTEIPREEFLQRLQDSEQKSAFVAPPRKQEPKVPTEMVEQLRESLGPELSAQQAQSRRVESEKRTAGPPSSEKKKRTKQESNSFSAFSLVSMIFIVVAALYGSGVVQFKPARESGTEIPFQQYWVSDQPGLMTEVAEAAALDGNERARRVILADVQSGKERLGVNSVLLRAASNRLWYSSFRERDRSLLFRIALVDLIPDALEGAPAITSAHAGLLFGVVASLSPGIEQSWYSSVGLARFASLPAPLGPAFVQLSKLGVKNLGDPTARGLAHLLVGLISPDALLAFSSIDDSAQLASQKLLILIPFLTQTVELAKTFGEVVEATESGLQPLLSWFATGSLDSWNAVPVGRRLLIASGELPERDLSFEQLADLLRYPVPSIREQTAIYMAGKYFHEHDFNTLAFLTSKASKLSRAQTVFLLSALRLEGEPAFTFLSKWFETQPDPRSVFGILLARKGVKGFDAISVNAASYIKDKEWNASLRELELASDHPEPLLRALVYARLSATDKAQRIILEQRAEDEPDARLKQQVEAKLADASS